MTHPLALIALLPLLGFLVNGVFATAIGGQRFSNRTAALVGCAGPMIAFGLTVAMFLELRAVDYVPIVAPLYRWAGVGA